jgi:hypothetical protein
MANPSRVYYWAGTVWHKPDVESEPGEYIVHAQWGCPIFLRCGDRDHFVIDAIAQDNLEDESKSKADCQRLATAMSHALNIAQDDPQWRRTYYDVDGFMRKSR